MSTYRIQLSEIEQLTRHYAFEVEADSEEEARDIAYDVYYEHDSDIYESETIDTDMDIELLDPPTPEEIAERERIRSMYDSSVMAAFASTPIFVQQYFAPPPKIEHKIGGELV